MVMFQRWARQLWAAGNPMGGTENTLELGREEGQLGARRLPRLRLGLAWADLRLHRPRAAAVVRDSSLHLEAQGRIPGATAGPGVVPRVGWRMRAGGSSLACWRRPGRAWANMGTADAFVCRSNGVLPV